MAKIAQRKEKTRDEIHNKKGPYVFAGTIKKFSIFHLLIKN